MKTKLLRKLRKRFSYYLRKNNDAFILIDREYSTVRVIDEDYYRELNPTLKKDEEVSLEDLLHGLKYTIFIRMKFYPNYFKKRRFKMANIYFEKHTACTGVLNPKSIYNEKTSDITPGS